MFASTFLTLALSFGFTQASTIPLHARGDAGIKIVLDITCTPLPNATGTLFMNGTSGIHVPLAIINNTLTEDGVAGGQHQQFEFQNCTSTFMAETPTDTTFYGHIALASDPSTCLVSFPGLSEPQRVETMPCRTADDSGQMLQFWKYTTGPDAAKLDFVGKSTRSDSTGEYVTDFTGAGGSRVVEINRVEQAPPELPFQITLVSSPY